MSTATDSFIIVCGLVLAGWALCHGCVLARGTVARWVVYAAIGVVACQFVFVPTLSLLGLQSVSTNEQYWACGFLAVCFHLIMDRIFPATVWAIEVEETDDDETD